LNEVAVGANQTSSRAIHRRENFLQFLSDDARSGLTQQCLGLAIAISHDSRIRLHYQNGVSSDLDQRPQALSRHAQQAIPFPLYLAVFMQFPQSRMHGNAKSHDGGRQAQIYHHGSKQIVVRDLSVEQQVHRSSDDFGND
jgi:hypothetical protein